MNATTAPAPGADITRRAEDLYLDLLKRTLTRSVTDHNVVRVDFPKATLRRLLWKPVHALLTLLRVEVVRIERLDRAVREEGRDWPFDAESMIGLRRLDNIQFCIDDVLRRGVPGDVIETGVWRGGATIFMRAVLRARGDTSRTVWVADSFEGLPRPDPTRYPADADDPHWTMTKLAVSLDEVRANFEKYGLLDERVRFLKGWFKDTLPNVPIERLAVMRLDGDMYESTMDALGALYPKLSVGGYAIVDDYGNLEGCRRAVDDFRAREGITEEIKRIDWTGVYWQRLR